MTASADPPWWLTAARGQRWYRLPWHLIVLAAWSAKWFQEMAAGNPRSWRLFVLAAKLFVGQQPAATTEPGGLHMYANYPRFQFGPVTLGASALIRLIGSHEGVAAAQILMSAAGLAILYLAERTAGQARPDLDPDHIRWAVLGAGFLLVPVWAVLAVSWAHLDDVLALLFAALAVNALVRGRPVLTGVFLALSGSAKPWAFAFMALLFALPAPRWRAIGWAAGVTLLVWAPFVIADPHSIAAARYAIPNVDGSGLRALGVNTPDTPSWDRAAQLVIGFGLSLLAISRGRWPAVILICTAVRVALDPNTYPYYDAGPVVGALIWDLMGDRGAVPVWTFAAGSLFWAWSAAGGESMLAGDMRVGFAVAVAAWTILAPVGLSRISSGAVTVTVTVTHTDSDSDSDSDSD
ncbi:MAG TPA: hypothetical protein VGG16_22575 [Streptosporangiaceae bacterium]